MKQKSMIPIDVEGPISKQWQRESQQEKLNKDWSMKIIQLVGEQPLDETAKAWVNACKRQTKALRYGDLEALMDWSGLTVRDLFGVMGVEIGWPNEMFRVVVKACEKLPRHTLEKVRDIAVQTTPTWWRANEEEKPSVRLIEASMRKTVMLRERKQAGKDPLVKRDHLRFVRLPPEELVRESERLGISMHWVLKLDPQHLIYSTKPEIEEILDAFSFMQPSLCESFVSALKESADLEGGRES